MAPLSSLPLTSVTGNWVRTLQNNTASNQVNDPNYFADNPQILIAESTPVKFSVGTGNQILTSIIPTCLDATEELIIVTCFWAKSTSQEAISSMLEELSTRAISRNQRIHVRLCFSSRSITQKLFQTSSLDGKVYPSDSWVGLGLPDPSRLSGLEMVVKSIFVRPFSVMHPKFVLIDRKRAFMPSCNVSWESWFEGCIEMQGGICDNLFHFWNRFWSRGGAELATVLPIRESSLEPGANVLRPPVQDHDLINYRSFGSANSMTTILLPSPHHINPKFAPLSSSHPPPTPLNAFLLETINSATRCIYMQTPNLTSQPVISAILSALQRGVSITLVTSSRLMIIEQIVTAGTITEFEVWKLQRRYNTLLTQYSNSDPERQLLKPGALKVGYYHARAYGEEGREPVKSHLKLTIIDEEIVVLGSGNMDRASWYTSQELGVALFGKEIAESIWECVYDSLADRVSYTT